MDNHPREALFPSAPAPAVPTMDPAPLGSLGPQSRADRQSAVINGGSGSAQEATILASASAPSPTTSAASGLDSAAATAAAIFLDASTVNNGTNKEDQENDGNNNISTRYTYKPVGNHEDVDPHVHGAGTEVTAAIGIDDPASQDQFRTTSYAAGPAYPRTPTTSAGLAPGAPASATVPIVTDRTPNQPEKPERTRSCEPCRGLKVGCTLNKDWHPKGIPCARCVKFNLECIVKPPKPREKSKPESRVADLEQQIVDLKKRLEAALQESGTGGGGATAQQPIYHPSGVLLPQTLLNNALPQNHQLQGPQSQPRREATMRGQKRKFGKAEASPSDPQPDHASPQTSASSPLVADIIDRGIITMEEASRLFRRYNDMMVPHLPAVVFPSSMTLPKLRQKRPILFLAVMSVASSENASMQQALVSELMHVLAIKTMVQGEKSMELLQSLLVCVIWYYPPEHFEQLQFYQLVHIAAVMAIDLGLGRGPDHAQCRLIPYTWRDHPCRKHLLPEPTSIESRRAWLAVYYLTSNVAMASRRPNLVRWQSFMTECLEMLSSSPEAAPGDRYLCHLVEIQHLAEEASDSFGMDDPSVVVNVANNSVQHTLRKFEFGLAQYRNGNLKPEDLQPSLLLTLDVLNLYIHEMVLQTNDKTKATTSNAEALRDPFPGPGVQLTTAHVKALSSCLEAIDGIVGTLLNLDVECIRCLPMLNFTRVAYAVLVLIKIYFSATSSTSQLGDILEKEKIQVVEYLNRLYIKLLEAAEENKCRPATKLLMNLGMIRGWFNQTQNPSRLQGDQGGDSNLNGSESPYPAHRTRATSSASLGLQQLLQKRKRKTPPSECKTPTMPTFSELSAHDEMGQHGQTNAAAPLGPNLRSPTYSPFMGPGPSAPFSYGPYHFVPPTTCTGGNGAMGMAGPLPQGGPPFIEHWPGGYANMSYFMGPNLGDGLEQAMDMTLGVPGGFELDGSLNMEGMRMMV